MTTHRTVHIGKLHPSGVENLTKTYEFAESVDDPYEFSDGNFPEKVKIQALVAEAEADLHIRDLWRRYGPYSSDLDQRVDALNLATLATSDDPAVQVPEDIEFLQLAVFHRPRVGGRKYSYGLMFHFGNYCAPDDKPDFTVLLPYERDRLVPALILSNSRIDNPAEDLGLVVKALAYAREHSTE